VPVVAAGLQVAAQVRRPEPVGVLLKPSRAAVVDQKAALDDQLLGRFSLDVVLPMLSSYRGYE
jgi:hypothetical protein